jgi:TRAP-type uncharacterized transport system fused permease subunit
MKQLVATEQQRTAEPVREPSRRVAPVPHPRRGARLIIALALVIVAGFLLGLGMPIQP